MQGAVHIIKQATEFRESGYLPRIYLKHVKSLLEKSMDLAQEHGDYTIINQLLPLIPKPDYTPLDQVKHLLRAKFINRQWWGWDALGIGKRKRESLLKMQNEEYILIKRKQAKKKFNSLQ